MAREPPVGIVIPLEEKSSERLLEPLVGARRERHGAGQQTILSRTSSDVSMIPEVANHLISSGGKRLRPILTLATAGLCGYRGEGHVKLAAAVEFMHTATLLHDDVVDESDLRRGAAAARVLWGNEASVLVGDFLLGQAFKMMVEVGSLPCLDVLSTAAAIIAEGEVMQLSASKDTDDDRGRLSRGDPRQDGGAVLRRLRGRPDSRQERESRDRGVPRLRRQSRHRVPADRRRARLRRLLGQARQERRRRFPRGQDHAARRALLPAGARRSSANSGSARWSAAKSARAIWRRLWRR